MKVNLRYGLLIMVMALGLSACGAAPTANPVALQPTEAAMAKPTEAMMDKPTEAAMAKPTEAMMDKPTEAAMAEPTEAMMDKPTEAAMAEPTEAMMDDAMPTEAAITEPTAAPVALAPWQTIALTDVRTGESFTLGDFAGRAVYLEPMATWCSNCKAQLVNVQQALTMFSDEKPIFVALSVETDLPPEQLAQYAASNGFDLRFAVASPELLQALVDAFGRTITNPPSTPHIIIAPEGTPSELMTGFHSAEEIVEMLQAVSTGA